MNQFHDLPHPLRIGARASHLSRIQTRLAAQALIDAGAPQTSIRLCLQRSEGDSVRGPLADHGGKGLFVAGLEARLRAGALDVAVHSLKDVPGYDNDPALPFVAALKADDPRDALIVRANDAASLDPADPLASLPAGARVGAGAPRRMGLLHARWPHLVSAPMRGNVPTRLRKLHQGGVDALILAMAGLRRLGADDDPRWRILALDPERFPPAAGQGVIALQTRADAQALRAVCVRAQDPATRLRIDAERATLEALRADCRAPVAAHAVIARSRVRLRALAVRPQDGGLEEIVEEACAQDAQALGADVGARLRARLGDAWLDARRA